MGRPRLGGIGDAKSLVYTTYGRSSERCSEGPDVLLYRHRERERAIMHTGYSITCHMYNDKQLCLNILLKCPIKRPV